jgi:SNF2 family DNA or RNA helicase
MFDVLYLSQWKEEIEEKTNGILTVHVHHGREKLKVWDRVSSFLLVLISMASNMKPVQKKSEIKSYDVLITTYQTLMTDFVVAKGVEPHEVAEWLKKNGWVSLTCACFLKVADA